MQIRRRKGVSLKATACIGCMYSEELATFHYQHRKPGTGVPRMLFLHTWHVSASVCVD